MSTRRLAAIVIVLVSLWVSDRPGSAQTQQPEPPKPKRVEIAITPDGFSPGRVDVAAGVPIELVFIRKTDKTCATEVVVPALKIKRPLPLNEPVAIPFTPEKGDVIFACGMNMLKGKLVVK
jgi:plastocyanin domain-containing protein